MDAPVHYSSPCSISYGQAFVHQDYHFFVPQFLQLHRCERCSSSGEAWNRAWETKTDGASDRLSDAPQRYSIPISSASSAHCPWARSARLRNTAPVSGSTVRAVYSAMQLRVR